MSLPSVPTFDFTTVRLGPSDTSRVQDCFEACDDYYLMATGETAQDGEAQRELTALPTGKSLDDKFFLGFVRPDGSLGGILDLVRDYPAPGIWYLGLLLLRPEERGHGRGETLHAAMLEWAKAQGASRIRLGVLEQNEGGRKFWERLGYQEIARKPYQAGQKSSTVLEMERPL